MQPLLRQEDWSCMTTHYAEEDAAEFRDVSRSVFRDVFYLLQDRTEDPQRTRLRAG